MKRCFAAFTSHYLLAQFIHLREVPDGRASQGGCVLHKHHLALVLVHGDHLPVQGLGPDVMKGHAAADVCSCCRPAADCTRCSLLSSWKSPEPVAACCRCCSQFCPRQSRIVLERLRWGDFKTFANFASFSSDVTEVVELAGSQSTDDDCWVGRRVILTFVTYCYLSDTIESILCLA